jgi:heme-degrading monooxygenase HmoA
MAVRNAQIVRIWRGSTRKSDAQEYERYLLDTGFVGYQQTPGNLGVRMTRRDVGDLTEFFVISIWESWDSIRAFAGEDIDRAVYYPEDDRFLVTRDDVVAHYETFAST